ncbi:ribonuclease Z mitochondrial precursor [Massariosphaeria phaeospora]|uniref:ribonuclease Z n=1 Tax=Massariosphaeria phaeospora TaxID=100035 RepID=A0A7C8I4N5_9PLEO|nr:ribonuclease Z mitochondrial precursor [Massariosphaeria phaeospora]
MNIQFVTVPTGDTPGTTLVLQTYTKNYIFGHLAEGTQRSLNQTGQRLTKVQDCFITGKLEWRTIGGMLGLALTLADSSTASYQSAMESYQKKKTGTSKATKPELPRLNLHGPPNLKHSLGTCRRFLFRKGMPFSATEYRTCEPPHTEDGSILPSWQDENIKVWAFAITPAQISQGVENKVTLATEIQEYEAQWNNFEDQQAPASENPEDRESRYNRIRSGIVDHMFNSDWSFDTLIEKHISNVQMPAAIFVRNPDTNRLESYKGPQPGGPEPLPDIRVLTRTPWPGAMVYALPPTKPALESVSYIVRSHPVRGKFDVKRAKELNVKAGPNYSKLTKGEAVQSENGETITPDMVIGPDRPGHGVAILDVPTSEYLEPLLQRKELQSSQVMEGVEAFIWILGPGLSKSPTLLQFMEKWNHVQHVISSIDDCPNRLAFESVAAQTNRLGQIDPARYQVPFHDNTTLPQNSLYGIGLPKDGQGQKHNGIAAERGTGSALPSKYRNVSATLLRVPGIGNYLFDAGENTLGQLQRMFPPEELVDVIKNLRMIWISHLHADHHLGTSAVIKAWYSIVHDCVPCNLTPCASTLSRHIGEYGLSVVSHEGMLKWLWEYSQAEDIGFSRILPLRLTATKPGSDCSTLNLAQGLGKPNSKDDTSIRREDYGSILGLTDIQACYVQHCNGAMAVSLTFPSSPSDPDSSKPLKVSYSGDCRPSSNFAYIGRNSTLLIHEATFDDELQGDAIAKKHSTTSEALGIGARMDAPAVVLTHFSQRYQKIPVLQKVGNPDQEDDLLGPDAMDDVCDEDGVGEDEFGPIAGSTNVHTSDIGIDPALPTDKPPLPAHRPNEHERVIKVSATNMKVAIAFDYMRVKLGEIAQMERFNDALNKLLITEEGEEDGEGEVEINENGKKTSGDDEAIGTKKSKKSKRNN